MICKLGLRINLSRRVTLSSHPHPCTTNIPDGIAHPPFKPWVGSPGLWVMYTQGRFMPGLQLLYQSTRQSLAPRGFPNIPIAWEPSLFSAFIAHSDLAFKVMVAWSLDELPYWNAPVRMLLELPVVKTFNTGPPWCAFGVARNVLPLTRCCFSLSLSHTLMARLSSVRHNDPSYPSLHRKRLHFDSASTASLFFPVNFPSTLAEMTIKCCSVSWAI